MNWCSLFSAPSPSALQPPRANCTSSLNPMRCSSPASSSTAQLVLRHLTRLCQEGVWVALCEVIEPLPLSLCSGCVWRHLQSQCSCGLEWRRKERGGRRRRREGEGRQGEEGRERREGTTRNAFPTALNHTSQQMVSGDCWPHMQVPILYFVRRVVDGQEPLSCNSSEKCEVVIIHRYVK